jgi:hypothetical protein
LKVDFIYEIPDFTTDIASLAHMISYYSKNDRKVLRIKDGKDMGPVLTVNVTGRDQMRLLGTAFDGQNSDHNSVSNNSSNIFVYYNHCSSNKLQ